MRWKGDMSMSTLSARPWKEQPRLTRRPSEAILSPATQTPGASALGAASMP